MSSPFPSVVARGLPFERGKAIGEQARARIVASVGNYEEFLSRATNISWKKARSFAEPYQEPIGEYDSEVLDEIGGIAKGAGLDYLDILALNARTELMYGITGVAIPECTSFAVAESVRGDGIRGPIIGQNWDWRPSSLSTLIFMEVEQPDRPSVAMIVEAGIVGKIGFNSVGLGVAGNFLLSEFDRGEPGVPLHIVMRAALNSHNVEEAEHQISRAHRSGSSNYLLADAGGALLDVETGPGSGRAFPLTPDGGVIGHANNFCAPIDFLDTGLQRVPDSEARTRRINELLKQHSGELGIKRIQEIMKDHDNGLASICRHTDAAKSTEDDWVTIAFIAMEPARGIMHIAKGNPCTGELWDYIPTFANQGLAPGGNDV